MKDLRFSVLARAALLAGASISACLAGSSATAQAVPVDRAAAAAPQTGEPQADPQTVPEAVQTQGDGAAEAVPATTAVAQDVQDIIVTGSRIGRSGFTTPQPVTVLSSDQLVK